MSHALILLRSRVSKIDSDAQENKPNKKKSLIFITFHSRFLSVIYAKASYLANDLATETASYTCTYLPIPVDVPSASYLQCSTIMFLLLIILRSLRYFTWVSWGYLPSTDILCRPQFHRFLPCFLCCYLFSSAINTCYASMWGKLRLWSEKLRYTVIFLEIWIFRIS